MYYGDDDDDDDDYIVTRIVFFSTRWQQSSSNVHTDHPLLSVKQLKKSLLKIIQNAYIV